MKPTIISIDPTYKKESGLWVLEFGQLQEFPEHSLVYFPPGKYGGNHSHPRTECFVCINGKLKLYWSENGKTQSLDMASTHSETVTAYIVPPHLVHAVKNETDQSGMLIEFATIPQQSVVAEVIIED